MEKNNGFKIDITKEIANISTNLQVFQVEVTNKIDKLVASNDKLSRTVANKFGEHGEYHTQNEHKWGFYSLLKKKPLIAIVIGIILSSAYGIGVSELIAFVKKIM